MTTLLLIRHGQSESNLQGLFTGKSDVPLSALGREQARLTADYIAARYAADAAYASPLCRARETGEIAAARFGLPVTVEEGLREIDGGDWEGRRFEELMERYRDSYHVWLTDIGHVHCDGGESAAQVQARAHEALRRIAEANPGRTVLVAAHGMVIRTLQCRIEGRPLGEMKDVPWTSNASVTEVFYENGAFRLGRIGFDGHLGERRTNLPVNA